MEQYSELPVTDEINLLFSRRTALVDFFAERWEKKGLGSEKQNNSKVKNPFSFLNVSGKSARIFNPETPTL